MTFFFEFSLRPFEVVEAKGGLLVKEADFKAENKILLKKNNLALQLCFPCYGIFPTRNALKLTFVSFQFQLLAPAMYYIIPI